MQLALSNIVTVGDTDVFPLPIENRAISDRKDKFLEIVQGFHPELENSIAAYPVQRIDALCQAGHSGFRWATQIDPFWNCYFLGLAVSIAEKIEEIRPSIESETIFSYRHAPDGTDSRLFKPIGWLQYRQRCRKLAETCKFVVMTDIADFYSRVYHHRIKNALLRLDEVGDVPSRIDRILSHLSGGVSYGLPIGGNASRILAELALSDTDNGLQSKRVRFCRFADDYTMFCEDETDAFSALVLLTERLHLEGLSRVRV